MNLLLHIRATSMNVGASSNIHQSIISFFVLVWKGGEGLGRWGAEEEKKVFGLCSLFFPKCKKKLLSPRYSYLTFLNYRLFMVILQKWCGGLFLYKHLKLAIEKKAKKVDAVSFLMSFYS